MVKTKIALFEGRKIRRHWDKKKDVWYFSVVDIISVLTSQNTFQKSRKYWNKLAERLRKEGSEAVTKCHQLKMRAPDGKFYLTDAADTETMFRIIQSIPSPKAEPFKRWLARVGYEKVQEIEDPELSMKRMRKLSLSEKERAEREASERAEKSARDRAKERWHERNGKAAGAFLYVTLIARRHAMGGDVRHKEK